MLPLDILGYITQHRKLIAWTTDADRLLSKYRLALEEIAELQIYEYTYEDDAEHMQEIAREALKE